MAIWIEITLYYCRFQVTFQSAISCKFVVKILNLEYIGRENCKTNYFTTRLVRYVRMLNLNS
jgi:hypothetical protein